MPDIFRGTKNAFDTDISIDGLSLGLVYDAILDFSKQEDLPSLWLKVCKNSRWIVPSMRMCALLHTEDGQIQIVGQFEGGEFTQPAPSDTLVLSEGLLADAAHVRFPQWYDLSPTDLLPANTLCRWMFKDSPSRLFSIPFKGREGLSGHLLFATKKLDDAERNKISPLATIYSLHAGLTLSLLTAIDEQKKADAKLAQLAFIVESSDEAIIGVDFDGIISSWNKRAARLFGYTEEEIIGKPLLVLIPETIKEDMQHIVLRLKQGESIEPFESKRLRKDGSLIDVLVTVSPIRDRKGQMIGHSGILRDLTRQKEMETRIGEKEQALQRNYSILLAQQEASADGILVVDDANKMVFFNRRFTDMWEIPEEIVQSKSDEQAVKFILTKLAEPEQFLAKVKYLYQHRDATDQEEIELLNGSVFDRYTAPIVGKNNEYYGRIWQFRDITQNKAHELQLKKAKTQAEDANKAKSTFLSRMSHELRTPLNAILGFSQLQQDYINDDSPDDLRLSNVEIIKGGRHLLMLIDDILDIVRFEQNKLDFELENVSLNEVIKESISLVSASAKKNTVQLRCESTAFIVSANHLRLKQVLVNLLSNAIKYNRKNGWVRLTTQAVEANHIKICIEDSGIGICSNELENIFIPFTRLNYAEHKEIQGTGIGLALSRFLVEEMQGVIGVESKPGHGSTFWVRLPQGQGAIVDYSPPMRDRLDISKDLCRTILYIEDNPESRLLIEKITSHYPHVNLITACMGEEGIIKAKNAIPDLIFLDLNLPGINGIDVLKTLRAIPSMNNTRIVAVSAAALPEQIESAMNAGLDAYITKPVDIIQIIEEIEGKKI